MHASVILTVIFCPIADADALNKPTIGKIDNKERKLLSSHACSCRS